MRGIRQSIIFFLASLLFYPVQCLGDGIHHRSVIIDTDLGLDDARAITWLLMMHDFKIEGIITSDGAQDPEDALIGLKKILEYYNKNEILISDGLKLNEPEPSFSQHVLQLFSKLPEPDSEFNYKGIHQFYSSINDSSESKSLLYICLGPVTNLLYATENIVGFSDKIEKIVFAGSDPFHPSEAWNTGRDLKSSKKIYETYSNIHDLNISGTFDDFYNDKIILAALKSENQVSTFIKTLHGLDSNTSIMNHLFLFDELIPLYLQFPDFFYTRQKKYGRSIINLEKEFLRSAYIDFLRNGYALSPRPNVVLKQFPVSTSSFKDDLGENVDHIISTHGLEEWKAVVLTNEMHRHLGAYSIVGVKMGILAREILEADLDELMVISYSGLKPPVSCLSDGLQVSTGASLGRGTINTLTVNEPMPKAVFLKGDQKLRLELKPEITQRIQSEIQKLSKQFGYGSHLYFREVRKMSIQYWVNLNRKHMFEVYGEITGDKIH
jgi:pyrimidine-specific ribonucleoside hydrolase